MLLQKWSSNPPNLYRVNRDKADYFALVGHYEEFRVYRGTTKFQPLVENPRKNGTISQFKIVSPNQLGLTMTKYENAGKAKPSCFSMN